MILEELDKSRIAVINPEMFHQKLDYMPKTAVCFFPRSLMEVITEDYPIERITEVKNATAIFPVYSLGFDNQKIAVMQVPVGAPACVANLEELISMGVENLILVGCCGCLDEEIEEYGIILPTSAIRDEGTSYHYMPAEDETILDSEFVKVLEDEIKDLGIPYITGKTWTTDAVFRETKEKVKKRKGQGAITVDMECSAVNVLARFRNVRFGQIFYAADNLGGVNYDPRHMFQPKDTLHEKKKAVIPIAFKCALAIDKKYNN